MIPLLLKFSGLYSYKEEQQIDFDPLTQAQLFGIFGPVGSGKSSILEAITIALFGKSDRLKHGDLNYNAMNLSSDRLLIDFTFLNYEGKKFRSVIESKRNSKEFGKVIKKPTRLLEIVNGIEIPTDREISDVLKISYENFKKTVIIPQGRFLEFLELKPMDRSNMLKELFNLERFDLSQKANVLRSAAKNKLSEIEGKLSTYMHASKELLESQELKFTQNQKDIKLWSEKLARMVKIERSQSLLKRNYDEFSSLKIKWERLEAQSERFDERKKTLEAFEYCREHFALSLGEKSRLFQQIQQNSASAKALSDKVNSLEKSYTSTEKQLQIAKDEFDEIPSKKDELEDVQEWIHIKRLKDSVRKAEESLKKGQEFIDRNLEEQEKLKFEIVGIQGKIKAVKERMPDFSVLSDVLSWHQKGKSLNDQHLELEIRISNYSEQRKSLNNSALKRLSEQFRINASDITVMNELMNAQISIQEEQIQKCQKEETEIVLHAKLEEFVDAIKAGDPCPLCGSEEHPDLLSVEGMNAKIQEIKNVKAQAENLRSKYQKEKTKIVEFIATYEAEKQEIVNSENRLAKIKKNIAEHESEFKWGLYTNVSVKDILEKQATGQKSMDALKSLDKGEDSLRAQLEKQKNQHVKFLERIQHIKNDKIKCETERKTRIDQLKIVKEEPLVDGYILTERCELLGKQIDKRRNRFEQLSIQFDTLKEGLQKNKQDLHHLEHHLEHDRESIEKIKEKIQEDLSKSHFDSESAIESILKLDIDRVKEHSEIRLFEDERLLTDNRLKVLKEVLLKESYESAKHEELIQSIALKEASIKELEKGTAKLELSIQDTKKDLEMRESLTKEREAMDIRREGLSDLARLFSGAKFINFISRIYLKEVCVIANKRFRKLTRKTLELSLSDNNDFLIIDYLNGAKKRKVSSLSGGQKFQAALSLALALAESVQNQLGNKQNFFFIDEGFGTLDKVAMQDAVQTLADLRKEGRIVGIISHIETLQEEVDIFLKVKNDPERGSMISKSWV